MNKQTDKRDTTSSSPISQLAQPAQPSYKLHTKSRLARECLRIWARNILPLVAHGRRRETVDAVEVAWRENCHSAVMSGWSSWLRHHSQRSSTGMSGHHLRATQLNDGNRAGA